MYKTTELNKIYYLWFGKCDGITVLPCSEMENLYSVIIWNMHYLIVRFFSRFLFTMFNYVTNRECSNTKSVKNPRHFVTFFLQMSSSLLPQKCSSKQATHDSSILQKRRIMLGFIVFHTHLTCIRFIIRFLDCSDL